MEVKEEGMEVQEETVHYAYWLDSGFLSLFSSFLSLSLYFVRSILLFRRYTSLPLLTFPFFLSVMKLSFIVNI